ncbi:MAG: hypothetical protein ACTHNP_01970 [Solirubrobacterales bacterium]
MVKAADQREAAAATEEEAAEVREHIGAVCEAAGIPAEVATNSSRAGGLSGREIRTRALEAVLRRGMVDRPIHYRDWLSLLEQDGHAVAGKRPDAVFLNQVVRSPLVRPSARRGFYEVAPHAVGALRDGLGAVQRDLQRALAEDPASRSGGFRLVRDLSLETTRMQRLLDEAVEVLGHEHATAIVPRR